MSFLGLASRRFFDKLQHSPSSLLNSSRFRLPCPPYHTPHFWDHVYKDLEPEDVNEWGGFDLKGLLEFRYEVLAKSKSLALRGSNNADGSTNGSVATGEEGQPASTTWTQWMGITQCASPEEASKRYQEQTNLQSTSLSIDNNTNSNNNTINNSNNYNNTNESLLLLGCGNSKMGEQLLLHSFIGPILQIDISPKVIKHMTTRYEQYLKQASVQRMEFIVDDATTGLTSLEPESVGGGVIDKGLVDAFHSSLGPMVNNSDGSGNVSNTAAAAADGSATSTTRKQQHQLKSVPKNNNYRYGKHDNDDPIRNIVKSVHRVLQPSRPFVFFSRSGPEFILRRTLGNVMETKEDAVENAKMWSDIQVVNLVDLDMVMYRFVKASEEDAYLLEDGGGEEKRMRVTTPGFRKKMKRRS